ncbi:MAG: VWA domain-containing protein [Bryobacteraceae bacterium]|jgi:VWFA-related protein
MRTRKTIIATFLAWLLAASAQQPAPRPQPPQQQANAPLNKQAYKFDVTSQLVIESVSVKDKDGKPVEGLAKSDFTVTEDGKPQEIKVFDYERLEENVLPPAPPPTPQTRTAAPPEAVPAAPAAPVVAPAVQQIIAPAKPGEIKYKDSRLMVLYFDLQGMPTDDQIRAQSGATKFLSSQMTPADKVAIMTYAGDLKVLQDFTDDRDLLLNIIKRKIVVGEASEMANTVSDDTAEDTGAAFTADDAEFNIFNTDRQLTALENAVKMLASLPEKKAFIYFSSGISRSTGMDNDAQLKATVNAAIRSDVAFYPVDARGMVATAPSGNATRGSGGNSSGAGNSGNFSGGSARSTQSNLQTTQDTLYGLAADTGGKAFFDYNDLAMGVVAAQKDISSYYILGYYSANANMDGKYRRIKVQIGKNLSAKLDYRQGYFANKEFKQFNSSDRENQLAQALQLGDPITDLSLAVETDYFRRAADRYFVPISVKMPGTDVALAKQGKADSTRMDFIGQIRDAKGQVVGTARDYITVKLKDVATAELAKKTLAYDVGFTLQPGTYSVKFLARENETGKMGTFETKFTVPDLSKDAKYIPISSVILSNQREKMANAVGSAGGPMRLYNFNPMVQDGEKLIPSVTRVFRKDQEMYVFLEAYEPNASKIQPLVATLSFYRGKVKAFETDPIRITEGLNDMTKAVPVTFSLPLAKLDPGRYTCQVSLLQPDAQRFAFWRAAVVLLP